MAEMSRSTGGDVGLRDAEEPQVSAAAAAASSPQQQLQTLSDAVELDELSPDRPSSKALGKAPAISATMPAQDSLTIDLADPDLEAAVDGDPVVNILLLQTSSSSRHPFRIDEKYLAKRNVNITGKTDDGKADPFSITVYTLKELILRDWRKEWDTPPREPVSIRLIYFGKMLEDRQTLTNYNFSKTSKNVVHMTVKPQEIVDEEEATKRVKDSSHHSGRGGCCIIL
ncbi:ubiquitin-related domain-containing protein [Pseudomassariella vexata]|uniref:Ubiquitin-related domain-containing protein n=1 Tax=Pseudomassariella vexata TaxID=1141098 RepID=A0A1Y2DKE0_9PEZI|nr:ubiquitin-related domain-containing protein [Pseudomassariella vexata]ORY59692.1 ubiquitin-related domain-containing protein [Pseudomassariella vexata]